MKRGIATASLERELRSLIQLQRKSSAAGFRSECEHCQYGRRRKNQGYVIYNHIYHLSDVATINGGTPAASNTNAHSPINAVPVKLVDDARFSRHALLF